MASISVKTPEGAYEIVIRPGLLAELPDRAAEFGLGGTVLVITNSTLAPLYGRALVDALPNGRLLVMPDGEPYKTLETTADLYAQCVAAGADRGATVLALGGGVVGDVAGFVAATYMRGLRLVQMPTSLLAMVDSSVGGKVGVDLPQGKNLVGAFKQPHAVLIDPDVLATLPEVEWRCGMAEVLKHGLIADAGLLDPALHRPDSAAELVRRAVQVKVDIVEQDPFEQGIRAHLNLGHTFAHAIEQVSGYRWQHGQAVGAGLLAAARLSQRLGLCSPELVAQVQALLAQTGLPQHLDGLEPAALWAAMQTDKKWRQGRPRFVLLRAVGDVCIVEGVERDVVIQVLETMQ